MDWSMVDDGHHSRFPLACILDQNHNLSIKYTYPPIQLHTLYRSRFKEITEEITFNNEKPPPYKYNFCLTRQLIDMHNHNIETIFHPFTPLVYMS